MLVECGSDEQHFINNYPSLNEWLNQANNNDPNMELTDSNTEEAALREIFKGNIVNHIEQISHRLRRYVMGLRGEFQEKQDTYNKGSIRRRYWFSIDESVYTGESGIAFALLKLIEFNNKLRRLAPKEIWEALDHFIIFKKLNDSGTKVAYLENQQRRGLDVTFLCGYPGLLCSEIYYYCSMASPSSALLEIPEIKSRLSELCFFGQNSSQDSEPNASFRKYLDVKYTKPDELLYGRSGLLYALLFAYKTVLDFSPPEMRPRISLDTTFIRQLVDTIVQRGVLNLTQFQVDQMRTHPSLYYEWHNTDYLGGAHGLAGICLTLLETLSFPPTAGCVTGEQKGLIKGCIDYIVSQQFEDGNFSSRIFTSKKKKDKMVQFCHGAPGVLLLLCRAYRVYGENAYLEAAKKAAEAIWKRGLLTKGNSVCHGISGNALTFLSLYRITNDLKYYYWALQFADFSLRLDDDERIKADYQIQPDRPFSFFEGLAGHLYFLMAVLFPHEYNFFGSELML